MPSAKDVVSCFAVRGAFGEVVCGLAFAFPICEVGPGKHEMITRPEWNISALTVLDLCVLGTQREAAYHFAEGAPNDEARDYILGQWHPWEPVLTALRGALNELGLLEEAEKLDLRSPVQDYFNPLFSTGWAVTELDSTND